MATTHRQTADYRRDAAGQFAARMVALGFRAFLAQDGLYGFITDQQGSRVLSFSFTDGGSLSGTYGPPSKESGTGWRMNRVPSDLVTAADVSAALYADAPSYCGKGWKRYSTMADYLREYGKSSRFAEQEAER